MRGSRKFSRGDQIPRRGLDLTENFNMAKINNLAIPGGVGGPDPLSPPLGWGVGGLDPLSPPSGSAHAHM